MPNFIRRTLLYGPTVAARPTGRQSESVASAAGQAHAGTLGSELRIGGGSSPGAFRACIAAATVPDRDAAGRACGREGRTPCGLTTGRPRTRRNTKGP